MKYSAFVALLTIAPIVASAQTTPTLPAKPLRHLEYSASTHYSSTVTSASYSGTSTGMVTDGADETITVDVMAAAKDGGLVVHAKVNNNTLHREGPMHTCAIYPNSTVMCPPNEPLEGELLVLLSYLGRGFYDPSAVNDGSWKTTVQTRDGSIVNTFKIIGSADANPLHIGAHQAIVGNKTIYTGWISDDDLTYDTKLEVPVHIHDEGHMTARGGSTSNAILEFKLVKDSFASGS